MKKTLCEALFFPKVAKNRNLVLAFLQYGVYIVDVIFFSKAVCTGRNCSGQSKKKEIDNEKSVQTRFGDVYVGGSFGSGHGG